MDEWWLFYRDEVAGAEFKKMWIYASSPPYTFMV
jgi:hypothetical protein